MSPSHPLAAILRAAAARRFPDADGAVTVLPPWRAGVEGVVALTGHAYLCTARPWPAPELAALGVDGFGGATLPAAMLALAAGAPWIDCLDVLLVGPGGGGAGPLVERPDLARHPRARAARLAREEVRVLGYADPARRDLATLARGIAGLPEIGVEADQPGTASRLFADALAVAPSGPVFAAIAPGNARSLRSALAAGFAIIGSVQLFGRCQE